MKEKVVFITGAKGGLGYFITRRFLETGATIDTPANRKAMPNADFSKWIQPRDVVNLVLSLTADRASKITGTAIPIGGPDV